MQLNCDIGEGFDEVDIAVMPLIDMANIACGGHVGDIHSMRKTLTLAKHHSIRVGAHPSYPDRQNFGRKSLDITTAELSVSLTQQLDNFCQHCNDLSIEPSYIKPHGALYNDCLKHPNTLKCVLQLAQKFQLPLMLQALPDTRAMRTAANTYNVELIFEAFADRRYQDNGLLVSRSEALALIENIDDIAEQAIELKNNARVRSISQNWLTIDANSLCVHGDCALAIEAVKRIRRVFA
ncbi:MAG: UPF0271 protein [Flavobacteriales bacterium]|jgi:UPF0271 protein